MSNLNKTNKFSIIIGILIVLIGFYGGIYFIMHPDPNYKNFYWVGLYHGIPLLGAFLGIYFIYGSIGRRLEKSKVIKSIAALIVILAFILVMVSLIYHSSL